MTQPTDIAIPLSDCRLVRVGYESFNPARPVYEVRRGGAVLGIVQRGHTRLSRWTAYGPGYVKIAGWCDTRDEAVAAVLEAR